MARGAYWARKIRVHYDPIAGNHSARNKGASLARGKYLFFSDAHMAYSPGFFKHMIATIETTGGLFHGTIAWMGAYPPTASGTGCGYTLKLGEEIKGTWNNYQLSPNHFFYIPALGHCSVGVRRAQFLEFGGYPSVHRSYGGGEFYLNMKWWMFGSSVATHPQAIGYHLASSRGYSWTHNDYVHNVLNIGYALGMDDWLERAYLNWLRHNRQEEMERMMAEAKVEMKLDREFIAKKRTMTFNELLVKRPWKQKNIETIGSGLDNILIFHSSWLDLVKNCPKVKALYNASDTQRELDKFIKENLWNFVYKKDNYDKNADFEIK
jgi:glycosyltransferase involved in cell wall biosynthesis